MQTFKDLILSWDKEELENIAYHGCANACVGGLIYYHQTSKAYDTYSEEIWDWLNETYESFGYKNPLELVASFNGCNDVHCDAQFKNLLVWAYVESVANEAVNV